MSEMQLPDVHYLNAARGWLELGNPNEALAELNRIDLRYETHPDVLEVSWHIHAKEQRWDDCLQIGRRLLDRAPNRPGAWISMAQSFYRLRRYQEAFDTLRPALDRFPQDPYVHYDLACYLSLLGQLEEARESLRRAFALGGNDLSSAAREDPDLEPLWGEIGELLK